MSNRTQTTSRLIRALVGAALGFLLHMGILGLVIVVSQVAGIIIGSAKTGEGIFWGLLLALMFSPAGIMIGAITGFAGSSGDRSWLQVTCFGAIPAVISAVLVSLSFLLVYDGADFRIGALVGVTGLLIAAVVAAITRDRPLTPTAT